MSVIFVYYFFFFFNDTATTEIYTLSLHDALPIFAPEDSGSVAGSRNYVIERIGQFVEAGVDEIMFGGIPTGDIEQFDQIEQEIVSAFT